MFFHPLSVTTVSFRRVPRRKLRQIFCRVHTVRLGAHHSGHWNILGGSLLDALQQAQRLGADFRGSWWHVHCSPIHVPHGIFGVIIFCTLG